MTDKALVNFSGGPFDGTVTVNRQELDISRGKPGEQLWAAARVWHLLLLKANEGVSSTEMMGRGCACVANPELSLKAVPHQYIYHRISETGDTTIIDVIYAGLMKGDE
jgi:hypothetical protein